MRWSGRSASPARRWWDRAARRHARRGSKIPEDDRSFLRPVLLYLKSRRMLMARASGVKAVCEITRSSKRLRLALRRYRKNRYVGSFLFFAARSEALVWPPLTLIRFNESRMPWVGIGARFELIVLELTPIHEISEDSRPYSIFGQRFMTTLRPAASAFAAAKSSRAPSCIQTTFGSGAIFKASSTTGMIWLEFLKISTMST